MRSGETRGDLPSRWIASRYRWRARCDISPPFRRSPRQPLGATRREPRCAASPTIRSQRSSRWSSDDRESRRAVTGAPSEKANGADIKSAPRVFTDSQQDGSAQIPINRQMLMRMIVLVSVGAPDIRPDLRGPQRLLAGAQDDPQRFVVEYERQTGHGDLPSSVIPHS